MHERRRRTAVLALAPWLWAAVLYAQPAAPSGPQPTAESPPATRADARRREREAKQASVAPIPRSGIERALDFVEDKAVFLLTREGLYPKLGSLTTGSGFSAGAGYRNSGIFNRYGTLDLWAAGSLKQYFGAQTVATFPELADGRLFLQGYFEHRDYPEEDFFGLGPDSQRSDQVSFALRGNAVGGRAAVQPVRKHVYVGGGIERTEPRIGHGRDSSVPSIETLFSDAEAPGLSAQPDFLRSSIWIEVDYRRPTYARNGGWYRAEYSRFDDRTLGAYSFYRLDLDLRHAVSVLGERRVLWGRALVSSTSADAGQTVPFYEMPTLGGNSTLRGFRDYRFRGPHSILLQGEYRIEVWSALDLAFFYDAGKVALTRSDLDFSDLERDYGVGFRFNSDNGIFLRVDAAFGSRDGKHLWIVFGGVF